MQEKSPCRMRHHDLTWWNKYPVTLRRPVLHPATNRDTLSLPGSGDRG